MRKVIHRLGAWRGLFVAISALGVSMLGAFTVQAAGVTITTFAGPSESPGSSDGPLSVAGFTGPSAIARDASGNLYVADGLVIRKISAGGMVTTLAGLVGAIGSTDGTGCAARFGVLNNIGAPVVPLGIAVDSSGNVYVADTGNHTIRKITSAGVVTTLAGLAGAKGGVNGTGSAARFNGPQGLACDASNNVYVADTINNAIRKITSSGVVTTWAGTINAIGGSANGTGAAAQFSRPASLAFDLLGNMYVTDSANYTIRAITPAVAVSTLAGTPGMSGHVDATGAAARFSVFLNGIATDSANNVYATDGFTIRKITPGGVVTTPAGTVGVLGSVDGTGNAAQFTLIPAGMASDASDNLYVAEQGNFAIRKITPAAVVTTFAGASNRQGSVDAAGSAARFGLPGAPAIDSAGNIYVPDAANFTVRKITPAGVVTTFAGTRGISGSTNGALNVALFSNPIAIAFDSSTGNLYVADNLIVRKISGGIVSTMTGTFGGLGGIATDNSGNVYVTDNTNNIIRKYSSGGALSTLAGVSGSSGFRDGAGNVALFNNPNGIATDGAGNIYVADTSNLLIRKVTSTGVVSTLAGQLATPGGADGAGSAAQFWLPQGMAADVAGNVYVTDENNGAGAVRKITPGAMVSTVAGLSSGVGVARVSRDGTGSAARFASPNGIAVDASGNLYVADGYALNIRIGKPSLSDTATIDQPVGAIGIARQLNTSPQTASNWVWSAIRQPSSSSAVLSVTSIRNPTFSPDVPDLFEFRLVATDSLGVQSITIVDLNGVPPGPPPSVSSVSPNSGPVAGGGYVTVTGTNFSTAFAVTVMFGGIAASNVAVISATQLTCTAPAHSAGAADVAVINPDGQSGVMTGGYTYIPAPAISSLSPASGPPAGGTSVTISGSNFATSGAVTVSFGGIAATNVVVVNSAQITCTTPANSVGAADVTVVNPNGQSGTKTNGFLYTTSSAPPPSIGTVSPNLGPPAGGTSVTITGANFATSGIVAVTFGGIAATGITVSGATQITCTTPANALGAVDVTVTNPDLQSSTKFGGFTYSNSAPAPAPSISNVSPNAGPATGGTAVTITGANFAISGNVTVKFGGVAAPSLNVISATQIVCATPANTVGAADVIVINPDAQTGVDTGGFTYTASQVLAPSISNITPNTGPASGGTLVIITGANFSTTGTLVAFGSAAANNVIVNSATQITCTTPANAAGAVNVLVMNPNSQLATLPNGFTYTPAAVITNQAPVITSLPSATPNPVSAGQPTTFAVGAGSVNGTALTYLWDFGDGISGESAGPTHVYASAGSYSARVVVIDGKGNVAIGSVTVTVNAASMAPPEAFTVTKFLSSVKFNTGGHDALSLSGIIPDLPDQFNPAGVAVALNIGGLTQSFTLDAKGKSKAMNGNLTIKLKALKGSAGEFQGGAAPFTVSITNGSFLNTWTDKGIDPTVSQTNAHVSMIITMTFNSVNYQTILNALYTSKAGVGGKLKK